MTASTGILTTRVLLVEDNPADILLLKEALRDVPGHGWDLSSVSTLEKALESLDTTSFDAVLLDLSLPDAEGMEIVYGAKGKAPGLPIVVLTGRDDSEMAVQAVRSGAQDYLVKGRFGGQLLVRSVRYAIERKRSLEAVERSERQFRALIEHAADLIAIVDAEWRIRFVSPSVERLTGYQQDHLVSSSIIPLVHPQDLANLLAAADAGRRTGDISGGFDLRIRHNDGSWRLLECKARSLYDDPVISGLVINAHDITDRRNAARRLRELNERLVAVIENAPLAIIRCDREGLIQSWNRGAEQLLGWAEQDLIGKLPPTLKHPDSDEFEQHLLRTLAGETLVRLEMRQVHRDGKVVDVNFWSAPLREENDEIHGCIVMMADVTEHKRLEEQFRHAQKMEAVGRLAGGVAHDFNNLLTVITGYAQIASRRLPPGGPGCAELQEVLAASERAVSLTKQLLALSRRQIFQPAHLDLNTLVLQFEKMLLQMLGEDLELVIKLVPSLPAVYADASQLELVLLNLAANSRDAMTKGGTLTVESLQPSEYEVALRISDTGGGMPPEVLERIFEPFFTTKEQGKGTGLGLSTSDSIIRQHGGELLVTSVEGEGTTFEIRLPVARTHVSERAPVVGEITAVGGSETILLVEDDSAVAQVMRETLTAKGYAVLITTSGAEALVIAREFPGEIHLLLSDMVLRGGFGIDIAREVRALRPGIGVLFVSGYPESRGGDQQLDSATAFLPKPFAPEVLASKVREILDRHKARPKP